MSSAEPPAVRAELTAVASLGSVRRGAFNAILAGVASGAGYGVAAGGADTGW